MNPTPQITSELMDLVKKKADRVFYTFLKNSTPGPERGREPLITKEELFHNGMIGLLKARENFDEARNTPLRIYAAQRITGEMITYLRRNIGLVRVPQERYRRLKELSLMIDEMEKTRGVMDADAAAKQLGWSPETLVGTQIDRHHYISTGKKVKNNDQNASEFGDFLTCGRGSAEDEIVQKDICTVVRLCLKKIKNPEERIILIHRCMEDIKTLKELAMMFNCAVETVRNREASARRSFKRCIKQKGVI